MYWKHNPGADQTNYVVSNKPGGSNGHWESFKTRDKREAELGDAMANAGQKFAGFIATFPATIYSTLAPIVYEAAETGLARLTIWAYRNYKIINTAGTLGVGAVDPSGQSSIAETSAKNIALGLKGNLEEFASNFENTFHVGQWRSVGITSGTAGNFMDEFYEAVSNIVKQGGRIKFDLSGFNIKKGLQAVGKTLYDEGVGYTDWEFSQAIDKFKNNTDFYLNGEKVNIEDILKNNQ